MSSIDRFTIIATSSHPEMARYVSEKLSIPITETELTKFANGETNVKINKSIRGKHVYIIGTGSGSTVNTNSGPVNVSLNDNLMEILLLVDGCKRSLNNTDTLTVVLCNYPYARSDKKDHRGPISAKLVATLLNAAGIDSLITFDLHARQIQGFLDTPFANIYARDALVDYFKNTMFKDDTDLNSKYVLVSPDNGGTKRIISWSKRLGINNVIMHKARDYNKQNTVDKCILIANDLESLKGKTAIVVDDITDTMGTMVEASKELIANGFGDVIIVATHGVLSGEAINRINNNNFIKHVVVTNTIDQTENLKKVTPGKLLVVNVGDVLASVINRINTGVSISELWDN
jgi:ribose-phosphate pyrophosphokinase